MSIEQSISLAAGCIEHNLFLVWIKKFGEILPTFPVIIVNFLAGFQAPGSWLQTQTGFEHERLGEIWGLRTAQSLIGVQVSTLDHRF